MKVFHGSSHTLPSSFFTGTNKWCYSSAAPGDMEEGQTNLLSLCQARSVLGLACQMGMGWNPAPARLRQRHPICIGSKCASEGLDWKDGMRRIRKDHSDDEHPHQTRGLRLPPILDQNPSVRPDLNGSTSSIRIRNHVMDF